MQALGPELEPKHHRNVGYGVHTWNHRVREAGSSGAQQPGSLAYLVSSRSVRDPAAKQRQNRRQCLRDGSHVFFTWPPHSQTCKHTHICTDTCTHVHTRVHTHMHRHMHTDAHMYTLVCTHICTDTCTRMHTCTHSCAHTYAQTHAHTTTYQINQAGSLHIEQHVWRKGHTYRLPIRVPGC
jgi:hypothetical protein